jgi:hypothetical protein
VTNKLIKPFFIKGFLNISVQIRPKVHISERLSALRLTRHSFVLCRKGASVCLKGVGVVYKLLFASSTKRCIQNRSPPVEAKGLNGVTHESFLTDGANVLIRP